MGEDSCLTPVYALGLLRHTLLPTELADTLKSWTILNLKSGRGGTSALDYVFRKLASESESHQDALAEMSWNLVVHQSPKMRCYAARVLDNLASASSAPGDLVANKVRVKRCIWLETFFDGIVPCIDINTIEAPPIKPTLGIVFAISCEL